MSGASKVPGLSQLQVGSHHPVDDAGRPKPAKLPFVLSPLDVPVRDSTPSFAPTPDPEDHTTPFDREDPAVDILGALRPRVFLGSDDAATNLSEIQANGVTHILNMAKECPNHFEAITEAGLTYCRANLVDSPFEDFYKFIPTGIHFIESVPLDKAVLVHCGAGISRSPAMVIAYLMYKLGYRLREAVDLVKRKRTRAKPDLFLSQLGDMERFLDEAGHFNYRDACHARGLQFQPLPLPSSLPDLPPPVNGAPRTQVPSGSQEPPQQAHQQPHQQALQQAAPPPRPVQNVEQRADQLRQSQLPPEASHREVSGGIGSAPTLEERHTPDPTPDEPGLPTSLPDEAKAKKSRKGKDKNKCIIS